MQHQLDSEFIETGTKNLKIATLLLCIATACILVGLTAIFLKSAFEFNQEFQAALIAFSFLIFVAFSPISLIYSIRSLITKEPGKVQKRIVLIGAILYTLVTLVLAASIAYNLLLRYQQ